MGKFFSFSGRIGRYEYWMWSLGLIGLALLAVMLLAAMRLTALSALVLPAFWFGNLSLTVRRWHDRNKSGVWVLLPFIPVIGAIWAFIELGFIEGTPGPNNYGWPYGTSSASQPAGPMPATAGVPYQTVVVPMPVQVSAPQPSSALTMMCGSCGDANDTDHRFCKRCGSRLQGPDIQPGEAWNPARI